MDKQYFISKNNEKIGPLTHAQLVKEKITSDTLVWRQGLNSWAQAGSLDELTSVFELTPPKVIPNSASTQSNIPQDDEAPFLSFRGRITRRRLCIFFFLYLALIIIDKIISDVSPETAGLTSIFILISTPIMWMQIAKRFHDSNLSGWWQFIPLAAFVALFIPASAGQNQFGLNPRDK